MLRRAWVVAVLMFTVALPAVLHAGAAARPVFDIRKYGATGDGTTLDTRAIQAAIDAATAAGGGMVNIPPGVFLSGSLHLKSQVELHLEEGATLLGSSSIADYLPGGLVSSAQFPHFPRCALLVAEGQEDVAISGAGTIDGQGRQLAQDVIRRIKAGEIKDPMEVHRPNEAHRAMLLAFVKCQHVRVTGVTLKDSSCWVEDYVECRDLVIQGIHVNSTAYWNNDGIDITDCSAVRISGCDVNSADDGICLKSSNRASACDDVEIARCRIRSSASALKFGTASVGGFRNVYAHDLEVHDTFRSAVALESVDGGVLQNVRIENINATNTGNAIFLKLGHRDTRGAVGALSDVTIRNVRVEVPAGAPDAGYETPGPAVEAPHNVYPSSITGLPGHPVSNVVLENIEITYAGGGVPERARAAWDAPDQVPEQAADYPEFSMFGELPAWGFYVRHAAGIEFRHVRLALKQPDYRPALFFDDVNGLRIREARLGPSSGRPVVVLNRVEGSVLQHLQYPAGIPAADRIRHLPRNP